MTTRALPFALAFAMLSTIACEKPEQKPDPPRAKIDGARAWTMLSRALPGEWKIEPKAPIDGGAQKKPFLISYHLISNDSAIVERWGEGSGHDTETVFHPDHDDVLLTHYCAQGNQPRLRAEELGDDHIVFRFLDVTNKKDDQDMLIERTLRVVPDGIEDTEVYRTSKGVRDETVYTLVRR